MGSLFVLCVLFHAFSREVAVTHAYNNFYQTSKLVPSDGAATDRFGNSVAGVSNNSVLVGAYFDDDQGSNSGSAYLFTSSSASWVQAGKFLASDGSASDYFGMSVAGISDASFVVGSYLDDDMGANSGSSYIFTIGSSTSWVQADKLVASDGVSYGYFGQSVSNLGDSSVLIGAYYDDSVTTNAGAAYVFTSASGSWVQVSKVAASDGASADYFGYQVAGLSGTCFVAGAYLDDDLGSSSGSVYVFTSSAGTWVQASKLTASDGTVSDNFGLYVSRLNNNSFVVGSKFDDDMGTSSGSVYIFTSSSGGFSWLQAGKVVASDGVSSDYFAVVAGISDNLFAVGAYLDDDEGSNSGSAYAFTNEAGSWVQADKILAYDGATSDYFGYALSGFSKSALIIGAMFEDALASNSGSAYIFTRGSSTLEPTLVPTLMPTLEPSLEPTLVPTLMPTTPEPTFVPTLAPSVLAPPFYDDFCEDHGYWSFGVGSGELQTEDCRLYLSGGSINQIWLGDYVGVNLYNWTNYRVDFQMELNSSCNGNAGLTFRTQELRTNASDLGLTYLAQQVWKSSSQTTRIRTFTGGSTGSTLASNGCFSSRTNGPMNASVVVNSSAMEFNITISSGEACSVSVQDNTHSWGTVGFYTWSCPAYINFINVTNLSEGPPTLEPTLVPTLMPTLIPSLEPTLVPTLMPTTSEPTFVPTLAPSLAPSFLPTLAPTLMPTAAPTAEPTLVPTLAPSLAPTTAEPTISPTSGAPITVSCNYSLAVNGTNYCYTFPGEQISWSSAVTACRQLETSGGQAELVWIESYAENLALYSQFGDNIDSIWIGFTDSASEGTWIWNNGSSSYTNWYTNQPDGGSSANCGYICGSDGWQPGYWDDASCSQSFYYLCKYSMGVSTLVPTLEPTMTPTLVPTLSPTLVPTLPPTVSPTLPPSLSPTLVPTFSPTVSPTTRTPTLAPTLFPTFIPTLVPTNFPTGDAPEATSSYLTVAALNVTSVGETWGNFSFELPTSNGATIYSLARKTSSTSTVGSALVLSVGAATAVGAGAGRGHLLADGLAAGTAYRLYVYAEAADGTGADGLVAREFNTAPSPPSIEEAQFMSSGSKIVIKFSENTDQGSSQGLDTKFDCDALFVFPGYSTMCEWTTHQEVTATLSASSSAVPGDTIKLRSKMIKAKCTGSGLANNCADWSYAAVTNTTIAGPTDLLYPTIALSYPTSLSVCSDLTIDASGTTGSGSRDMVFDWNLGSTTSGDASTIQALLDSYGSQSSVTISSTALSAGNYTFRVTATNFLGGNGTSIAEVEVVNNSIPTLTILGSTSYTILRSSSLSFSATAEIPTCTNKTTSSGISFTWHVEEDDSIGSVSLAPRYFKVPAYTFMSNATYTVVCTATTSRGMYSTQSVTVTVIQDALVAKISGAAFQTVSLSSGDIILDGSGSYDKNEEDGTISVSATYTWKGYDSAGDLLDWLGTATDVNQEFLTLTELPLMAGSYYTFSLLLEEAQRSSNDTVEIYVVADQIPSTLADAYDSDVTLSKVDPSSMFVLKGVVSFGDAGSYTMGKSIWSYDKDSLSSFLTASSLEEAASSSLELSFKVGTTTTHYLVLPANSLTPGGEYIFSFEAMYSGSSSSSLSTITIQCNEAPSSGALVSDPDSGQSLVDTFDLSTNGWSDDADDFPLLYKFLYTDEDNDDRLVVIRAYGYGNTYKDAYLPEGYGSNSSLKLLAYAKDQYAAFDYADAEVKVVAYTASLADASSEASSILDTLLEVVDLDNLHTALKSFSVFLSSPNCTMSPNCEALNREVCEEGSTDNTCGACLSGYSGSKTDFAEACIFLHTSCHNGIFDFTNETDIDCGGVCGANCDIGQNCSVNSDCSYGLCENGVCAAPQKTCNANCSGQGACEYIGPTGLRVDSCLATDSYCSAVCNCYSDAYGNMCSMDEDTYLMQQALMGNLVGSLSSGLAYCDSDSDSLEQGSSTLTSVSLNVALLNMSSQVLILNMSADLVDASLDATSATLVFTQNGLDTINSLFSGTSLAGDASYLSLMSLAIDSLALGVMDSLVAGQDATEISTGKIATSTQVLDFSSIDTSSSLTAPATDDGSSSMVSGDVGVSFSGQSSVGASLSSITFNPYFSMSDVNITAAVGRLYVEDLSSMIASGENVTFEMTLVNYYEQKYTKVINSSQVIAYCAESDYETHTVSCGGWMNASYTCSGDEGTVTINCTAPSRAPSCIIWDGADWNNQSCIVKHSNATQTVCRCTYDSILDERRRLNGRKLAKRSSSSDSVDVSSQTSDIFMEVEDNFSGFADPFTDFSAVTDNLVVFIVMGAMFIIPLAILVLGGSIACINKHVQDVKAKTESNLKSYRLVKTWSLSSVRSLKDLLGLERKGFEHSSESNRVRLRIYSKGDRTRLFWKGWIEGIEWFELMSGGYEAIHDKILICVTLLCFLFTLMCWDATFTPIFSGYNATSSSSSSSTTDGCGSHLKEAECDLHWTDGCYWNNDECKDSQAAMDSLVLIMYTSALSIVMTTPCLIFIEWLIAKTIAIPMPPKMENNGDDPSLGISDIDQQQQIISDSTPSIDTGFSDGNQQRKSGSTPTKDTHFSEESVDEQEDTTSRHNFSAASERSNNCDEESSLELRQELKQSMSEWVSHKLVQFTADHEIDIEGDESIPMNRINERANEMLLQQRQQGPSLKLDSTGARVILTRDLAKRSIALEDELADLCNSNQMASAECLLLSQARWDYMTSIEKRAVRRIKYVLDEEDGEEEEEDTGLSHCNVRVRHILGWFLVVSYMFITAYYVCLFGINYGASYTNAWLEGFFIALFQELSIFVPLRVLALYCILPGLTNPKIQPKRFCNIKRWSPSWHAAKSCPHLVASQLVLASVERAASEFEDTNLEDQKKDLEEAYHSVYLFLSRNDLTDVVCHSRPTSCSNLMKGFKVFKAAILVAIFSPVLFFPEVFADTVLDLFIAYVSGYSILGFYQGYLISGFSELQYWGMTSVVLATFLITMFVVTQPRLRRRWCTKKNGKGLVQNANSWRKAPPAGSRRRGSMGGRGKSTSFMTVKRRVSSS